MEKTVNDIMFIRRATTQDALAIKKVHTKTYKKSYHGYLPDDVLEAIHIDDDVIERTQKYISQTESYVVESNGKIIAFSYITYPENKVFEINALYVDPDYQKQGAGLLLVDNVCSAKAKDGYDKCLVWTLKGGPSVNFYLKQGFIFTSLEKIWKYNLPIIMLEKQLS